MVVFCFSTHTSLAGIYGLGAMELNWLRFACGLGMRRMDDDDHDAMRL
jgi:hypothetical protein